MSKPRKPYTYGVDSAIEAEREGRLVPGDMRISRYPHEPIAVWDGDRWQDMKPGVPAPSNGDFRPTDDGGLEVYSGGRWLLVVTPGDALAAVLRRFIVEGIPKGEYVRLDDDGTLVLDGQIKCTRAEALVVKELIEEAERG